MIDRSSEAHNLITALSLSRTLAVLVAALALLGGQAALAMDPHAGGAQHGSSHSTQSHSTGHGGQRSHAAKAGSKPQSTAHAGRGPRSGGKAESTSHVASAKRGGNKAEAGVKRDEHGKIARSSEAKAAFKNSRPCPSTGKSSGACPGYVVDHVVPLKRGGADRPDNMQWQTTAAAKAKDKTE